MKKKSIFAMLFCLIISVCVLFTGCGETDLSDINAKIETMQQQITDLQNRLNEAEENQQDLLLDLTTAKGQLLTLQEQVNGKENNYYKLNDTITYSISGTKVFEITLIVSVYNNGYVVGVNFSSSIENTSIDSKIFNFTSILYNKETSSVISNNDIVENSKTFEGYKNADYLLIFEYGSYKDNNYILFLYSNNNLFGLVELNFVLLS